MQLLSREEFTDRLSKNIVEIRFTKVNGEERQMRATLKPDLVRYKDSYDTKTYVHPLRMNVWDVDKDDWRSFYLDRVLWVMTPVEENNAVVS